MDDDAGAADAPIGDAIETGPVGRPAPSTSRAVAMFAVVFLAFGLIAAAAWFVGGGSDVGTMCTAEGMVNPTTGETYRRDPAQDCRFVDAGGNVIPGQ